MSGGGLIFLLLMFVVLYLVMIRPQRARMQKQQQLLRSVDVGDEVLTVGGLYGIVQELDEDDDDLVVEVAEGVNVRIARRSVAQVHKPEDEVEEVDAEVVDEGDGDAEPRSPEDTSLAAAEKRVFGGGS
ncbi:MAG: preprotein translocase subunit YajC [Gaiella sp.]